jgi:Stage II sporulation protein E (SpoIIE)
VRYGWAAGTPHGIESHPTHVARVRRSTPAPRRGVVGALTPYSFAIALAGVVACAVVYPMMASGTRSALAIFAVPILFVSALGTLRQTIVVGVVATTVATVEGLVDDELDASALAARLAIIVPSFGIGVLIAVERARHARDLEEAAERSVLIDAFRSSLAPVPVPPRGVRVAVRFRFGDERLRLGGDFLDAIELSDGALGYIIGDVCGHGVRSAALGSAIRTGWKTIATHAPTDPVLWANALEQAFFRLGRREGYVTVNTGRLDVETRSVDYVSAGHPWPIVITDEHAEMVAPDVSPPLGTVRGAEFRANTLELAAGATLLLYTDGLYEHPHTPARDIDGESRLLEYLSATATRLDLDAMLDHFGRHGFDDDVALMTIRTSEPANGWDSSPGGTTEG